jgi:hypothetical protein
MRLLASGCSLGIERGEGTQAQGELREDFRRHLPVLRLHPLPLPLPPPTLSHTSPPNLAPRLRRGSRPRLQTPLPPPLRLLMRLLVHRSHLPPAQEARQGAEGEGPLLRGHPLEEGGEEEEEEEAQR